MKMHKCGKITVDLEESNTSEKCRFWKMINFGVVRVTTPPHVSLHRVTPLVIISPNSTFYSVHNKMEKPGNKPENNTE